MPLAHDVDTESLVSATASEPWIAVQAAAVLAAPVTDQPVGEPGSMELVCSDSPVESPLAASQNARRHAISRRRNMRAQLTLARALFGVAAYALQSITVSPFTQSLLLAGNCDSAYTAAGGVPKHAGFFFGVLASGHCIASPRGGLRAAMYASIVSIIAGLFLSNVFMCHPLAPHALCGAGAGGLFPIAAMMTLAAAPPDSCSFLRFKARRLAVTVCMRGAGIFGATVAALITSFVTGLDQHCVVVSNGLLKNDTDVHQLCTHARAMTWYAVHTTAILPCLAVLYYIHWMNTASTRALFADETDGFVSHSAPK